MKTHKFKIGDKVRILPSAVTVHVTEDEVGKTGVIKHYYSASSISVYMDKPWKMYKHRELWNVDSSQIEPVIVVGQQLMLWSDL